MKRLLVLSCVCTIAFLSGCGEKVPEGFPKTVSCQVTVTDGGSPIEGASVGLIPDKPMNSIVVGGNTDSAGKAIIRTMQGEYSHLGAPEGSYTVTIAKTLPVDMPTLTDDEFYKQTAQQKAARDKEYKEKLEKARVVPEVLNTSKSPLKLDVGSTGGTLEVDIKEYKK